MDKTAQDKIDHARQFYQNLLALPEDLKANKHNLLYVENIIKFWRRDIDRYLEQAERMGIYHDITVVDEGKTAEEIEEKILAAEKSAYLEAARLTYEAMLKNPELPYGIHIRTYLDETGKGIEALDRTGQKDSHLIQIEVERFEEAAVQRSR